MKRPMDYVVLVGANLDGGGEGRGGEEFSGASTILLTMCHVNSLDFVISFSFSFSSF